MEIFKDIKGYSGMYQISNYGNVKSLSRQRNKSQPYYITKDKILKPGTSKYGYKYVILTKAGSSKSFLIHRLVAAAFKCNIKNKPCCNHIDGNKINNNADNLEWCTYMENTKHAIKTDLMDWSHACRGENHGMSKLTEDDVRNIKVELKSGKIKCKEIANNYNVSYSAIYFISIGRNWSYITV